MIWQCEKNITQHLETVLQTLFKASGENIPLIQDQIFNCARLVGIFTDADISLQIAFKTIRKMSTVNHGSINILNGLLIGFAQHKTPFNLVIDCLNLLNELCWTLDVISIDLRGMSSIRLKDQKLNKILNFLIFENFSG